MNLFIDALDEMADGVKTTFIIDAFFKGGFIELAHGKVVLFTSSQLDELSAEGSLGYLFINVFVECIKENLKLTHQELIDMIQRIFGNHGGLPLPEFNDTLETMHSIIFL